MSTRQITNARLPRKIGRPSKVNTPQMATVLLLGLGFRVDLMLELLTDPGKFDRAMFDKALLEFAQGQRNLLLWVRTLRDPAE